MRRITAFAALTLVLGMTEVASAYVLPAEFLMRMLADRRRDLGVKDLSLTLTAEVPSADAPLDERIYLKVPERLRYVRQDEDTNHVLVEREGARAEGTETALQKTPSAPVDLTAALFAPLGRDLDEMSARMLSAISKAGIDTKTVALGRHGEAVGYIIGARVWESDKPQLWLYKSTFLPMRQVSIGKDEVVRETRWLDWGASVTGDYYPLVTENYENGKLVRRAEVSKLTLNQNLPETLFDLPN